MWVIITLHNFICFIITKLSSIIGKKIVVWFPLAFSTVLEFNVFLLLDWSLTKIRVQSTLLFNPWLEGEKLESYFFPPKDICSKVNVLFFLTRIWTRILNLTFCQWPISYVHTFDGIKNRICIQMSPLNKRSAEKTKYYLNP